MKQRYLWVGSAVLAVLLIGGLAAIVSQQDITLPTSTQTLVRLPSLPAVAQVQSTPSSTPLGAGTVVTGTVPPELMLLTLTMESAISDQLTQAALDYNYQIIQSTARAIIGDRQTATATSSTATPVSTTLLTQTMALAIEDQLTQSANDVLNQNIQSTARKFADNSLTATATLTTPTPTFTPTPLPAIPPEALTQTMQAGIDTQLTQAAIENQYDMVQETARAILTSTATLYTPTPTPTSTLTLTSTSTDPAQLTLTMQAGIDTQLTQAALDDQYGVVQETARAVLTATATFYTPTNTLTPTATDTPISEQTIQAAVNGQMTQISIDQTYAAIFETARATVNSNLTATATNIGPVQQTQTVQAAVNDYFTATTSARIDPTLTASFQTAVQRGFNQALTATVRSAQLTRTATYRPSPTLTRTPRPTTTPTPSPTMRPTLTPTPTATGIR